MKKTYLILEFFTVTFFLIIPPLLSTAQPVSLDRQKFFSFPTMIQALIAAAFFIQDKILHKENVNYLRKVFWTTLTLGLLFFTFAGIKSAAFFAGQDTAVMPLFTEDGINAVNVFFLALNFFCAAFYEETLYRLFFTESMIQLLPQKKVFKIFAEIFSILIFALSHRTAGWFAVINALVCGIILRLCLVKTKSVLCPATAHFIYNAAIITFTLLYLY